MISKVGRTAVRFDIPDVHEFLVREWWYAYLNPCCPGCRTGTADCDVNPLYNPPTQGDCALTLMRLGECP